MSENGVADVGGETLERFHADKRIAVAVEFGAPDRHRQVSRNVCGYSASYPALPRQTGTEGKIARLVVETACKHQGSETLGLTYRQHLLSVQGIGAPVAKEEECLGQILARHRYRALMAIDIQQDVHVILYIAETLHEVGQSHIAVSMVQLRTGYLLVIIDVVVAAESADKLQDGVLGMRIKGDQTVSYHKSPCIDERIARKALLVFELDQVN